MVLIAENQEEINNKILPDGGKDNNNNSELNQPDDINDSGKEINSSGAEGEGRKQIIQPDAVLEKTKIEHIKALTPPVIIEEVKESKIKKWFNYFFVEGVV